MAKIDSIKVNINKEEVKNKKQTTKKPRASNNTKKASKKTLKKTGKSRAVPTMIAIIVTGLIVGGGIYSWQKNLSEKNINKAQEDAVSTKSFFEKKLSELENKLTEIESENTELKTKKEELEGKVKLLDEEKKEFISEELGFSFLYPAVFGQINVIMDSNVTGTKFIGKFSNNDKLVFGGISEDYKINRDSVITDTRGYKKSFTKYYFKTADNISITVEPIKVLKYGNGKAILINADCFIVEQNEEVHPFGLEDGHLTAIINLDNDAYSGLAFWNKDVENFSNRASF